MSHHLDSVTTQSDGRLNLLDLYAYDRPHNNTSVVILPTCPDAPKSSPAQLHPDVAYDINTDTDSDLVEDVRLRINAGPPATDLARWSDRVTERMIEVGTLTGNPPRAGDAPAAVRSFLPQVWRSHPGRRPLTPLAATGVRCTTTSSTPR